MQTRVVLPGTLTTTCTVTLGRFTADAAMETSEARVFASWQRLEIAMVHSWHVSSAIESMAPWHLNMFRSLKNRTCFKLRCENMLDIHKDDHLMSHLHFSLYINLYIHISYVNSVSLTTQVVPSRSCTRQSVMACLSQFWGYAQCPSANSCQTSGGCQYTTPQSFSRNLEKRWHMLTLFFCWQT